MFRPLPSVLKLENENTGRISDKSYVPKLETMLEKTKYFKLSIKQWNSIIVSLNNISMFLIMCSLANPRWVAQGTKETYWRGGLFHCSWCSGKFENSFYKSITNEVCHNSNGYCSTFSRLYLAGVVLLTFSIVYFLCCGLWSVLICFFYYGKESNSRSQKLISAAALISLLISITAWHVISKTSYLASCNEACSLSKDKDLCAIDGPIIYLTGVSIQFMSCLIFAALNYCMNKNLPNKITPYLPS